MVNYFQYEQVDQVVVPVPVGMDGLILGHFRVKVVDGR